MKSKHNRCDDMKETLIEMGFDITTLILQCPGCGKGFLVDQLVTKEVHDGFIYCCPDCDRCKLD